MTAFYPATYRASRATGSAGKASTATWTSSLRSILPYHVDVFEYFANVPVSLSIVPGSALGTFPESGWEVRSELVSFRESGKINSLASILFDRKWRLRGSFGRADSKLSSRYLRFTSASDVFSRRHSGCISFDRAYLLYSVPNRNLLCAFNGSSLGISQLADIQRGALASDRNPSKQRQRCCFFNGVNGVTLQYSCL